MKNLKIKLNFIDKAFSYFAPIHGLRRLEARTRMALAGGYTGARLDRRQTKAWRTADGSADNVTLPDLPILRERSRDLLRNAPLATGTVNTVVVHNDSRYLATPYNSSFILLPKGLILLHY